MSRILALDFGLKRCGLAETDDLQIIASALETVPTSTLMSYLESYSLEHNFTDIVIGLPLRESGEPSAIEQNILLFIDVFQKKLPKVKVHREVESGTSIMAMQAMIQGGHGRKKRRVKGNLDKVSATIILQRYLERTR